MEADNQAYGKNAVAGENKINLESEDFYFFNQNKEEAKKNIDSSAKELTDFFDLLIKDIPDPSEQEVEKGVEKILERVFPDEVKPKKSKKTAYRVLLIAAILAVVASFSGVYVIGNSHNINIENGFVSFAKDTMQVLFFQKDEEEYITVDALLANLAEHGYDDILFPQEFVTKSDEYKVSLPEYNDDYRFNIQASFYVYNDDSIFSFNLTKIDDVDMDAFFPNLDNAKTVVVDDVNIYLFEYAGEIIDIRFIGNGIEYIIESESSLNEMIHIAKTLAKTER